MTECMVLAGGSKLDLSLREAGSELRKQDHQKAPPSGAGWGFHREAGDGLLSHNLSIAVPSALQVLTSVFGMGTGVAPAR